jgi:hypothetical protein
MELYTNMTMKKAKKTVIDVFAQGIRIEEVNSLGEKALQDLTARAQQKPGRKKAYDILKDFGDATADEPKHIQVGYWYIDGSVKDTYELFLN